MLIIHFLMISFKDGYVKSFFTLLLLVCCISPLISYGEAIYTTPLTGFEEVPPVLTKSTGFAVLKFDNNTLTYQLNVTNLNEIKSSHIHLGGFGENGDIIVMLFNSTSPTNLINGTLTEGSITTGDLKGPLEGKSLGDLISQINQLKTYINIHTVEHPNGEIRGQIANATAINATSLS